MGVAIVQISTDLILQALAFPEETKVRACIGERAWLGRIELVIEHPDLPSVADGQAISEIVPVFTWKGEDRPAKFLNFSWSSARAER